MMWLVIDPNLYVASALKHSSSLGMLEDVFESKDCVRLALDDLDNAIIKEYEVLATLVEEENARKQLGWLLENQGALTERLSVNEDCLRSSYLSDVGCDTPVEPHLLALCTKRGRDIKILAAGRDFDHELWKRRGIHDPGKVKQLEGHFETRISVWAGQLGRRALSDALRHQPAYPCCEAELEELLRRYDYTENEELEFKQPFNEQKSGPYHLNPSILDETMQAVCALSNTYGGRVLLGVGENKRRVGQPKGFELQYERTKGQLKPKNWEEIFNMIASDWLTHFDPPFDPLEPQYHKVELSNGRWVLVFSATKPTAEQQMKRRYRGRLYYRVKNITKVREP